MTVGVNTIVAEGLGDFFGNLGKNGLDASKKMAKNVSKNPGRALDFTANIATAAVSINPKNVLSKILELITFYKTGESLSRNIRLISCLLNETKNRKTIPNYIFRKK